LIDPDESGAEKVLTDEEYGHCVESKPTGSNTREFEAKIEPRDEFETKREGHKTIPWQREE
jgi:hypothetical protein